MNTVRKHPVRVLKSSVLYGQLGLYGNLGYENLRCSVPPEYRTWEIFSAHGDSELHIRCDIPVELLGCMDGSMRTLREKNGKFQFYVDGARIDALAGPWDVTRSMVLPAGDHLLHVGTRRDANGCHSLWLFRAYTKELATPENTVFLSSGAFGANFDDATALFRHSAERFRIPVTFVASGELFVHFYENKILRMKEELLRQRELGKRFAFVMDARDIIFLDDIGTILSKFNAMHDGRVVFNADHLGALWPVERTWFLRELQVATGKCYANLNSGCYAGKIDTILLIMERIEDIRRSLFSRAPEEPILKRIHREGGLRMINDDQFLYWLCYSLHPDLFAIDDRKQWASFLRDIDREAHDFSDDPRIDNAICKASIIHGSKPASKPGWEEWAERMMNGSQNDYFRKRYHNKMNAIHFPSDRVEINGLEVNVAYACNLRCEQCTHLGPFMKGTEPFEEIQKWFRDWSPKIFPREIRILGGEPLLHPDITAILVEAKKCWNGSKLVLVTNGMLLEKMDDEFFVTLKETTFHLLLSRHFDTPEYNRQFDVAVDLLKSHGVEPAVRRSDRYWTKTYLHNADGHPIPYSSNPKMAWGNCTTKHNCVTLMHDQLWKCPQLACFSHARRNGYVNEHWDGILGCKPLEPGCTPEEIREFLVEVEVEQCRFCPEEFEFVTNEQKQYGCK